MDTERDLRDRFPGFEWVSTHGSNEGVRYTLRSDAEWLVVDAAYSEVTRQSITDVARRAARLDAMETDDR